MQNIKDESFSAIWDIYGIPPHKIIAYITYQPEYYHFHVHFVHAENREFFQ